jgi:hypothetical protein
MVPLVPGTWKISLMAEGGVVSGRVVVGVVVVVVVSSPPPPPPLPQPATIRINKTIQNSLNLLNGFPFNIKIKKMNVTMGVIFERTMTKKRYGL